MTAQNELSNASYKYYELQKYLNDKDKELKTKVDAQKKLDILLQCIFVSLAIKDSVIEKDELDFIDLLTLGTDVIKILNSKLNKNFTWNILESVSMDIDEYNEFSNALFNLFHEEISSIVTCIASTNALDNEKTFNYFKDNILYICNCFKTLSNDTDIEQEVIDEYFMKMEKQYDYYFNLFNNINTKVGFDN